MWFRSFFLTKFDHFQTVQEVGEAMMTSLKVDKNGACYAVMPDSPLIEFPNELNGFMFAVVGAARFVRNLVLIHLLGFNPAFTTLNGIESV